MSSSSPGPALAPCPCGRRDRKGLSLPYGQCCGRYVDDFEHTPAPDAESLMRSRYTAFVRERADYLLATWHASTRPATLDFEPGVKWLGLDVRSHSARDADHAEVEFVARQRGKSGAALRLHERSRFVRESDRSLNRWFYVDGDLR
ncbi:YchJ family protein [Variovorax sp. Sphag1AA]|uniref:YchJ family protein n=1 Tax=Variovorax sp. Sphag1AA TaxID=2587027 RepID=UPI0016108DFE|nr:YchJ family metal-binding protein [Variovorax sp. Sphag1AA]MBB3176978.1 SEC-C motif-containing protein [Variovorax sp. Sphag1AA]